MKKIIHLFAGSLLFIASTTYAAEKVVVIVNSANTQSLSIHDVKSIYSDVLTTWEDGRQIAVYDLPLTSDAREAFSNKVLNMSPMAAQTAINNLKITNRMKNPAKERREALVVSIVSRKPDAIGYVSSSSVENKTGIRVLFELD